MTLLYLEIASKIKSEFSDGRFSPGVLMPSENAFVKTFAVSRTTIRKALQSLEKEGFLERRQGQGTFLRYGKYARKVSSPLGFASHGQMAGGRPTTKYLSCVSREKSIAEMALFEAQSGSKVFEMQRLRLVKSEPCLLQTSVLPIVELGNYSRSEFEKRSLYEILAQDFGIKIGPVKEILSCCVVPDVVASAMKIRGGDVLFVSHRIVRNTIGEVIEVSQNYIRSDRYCFVQDSAIMGNS